MDKKHNYYSDWYAKNRERLLPIRRKYNKEYSARPEVIAKAKLKNSLPESIENRKRYKKTPLGKDAEKRYRDKNKDKDRERIFRNRLKTRYGLTLEQYNDLVIKHNGVCAICFEKKNGRFHIDHCHKTNKVRGLLCTACNMGLGLFRDNEIILINAIKYLKK